MGSALAKEYALEGDQQACGGHAGLWRVYRGVNKKTKQSVSIFLFQKEMLKKKWKMKKKERENVLEMLRHGAAFLAKLRHPHVLKVLVPLKENGNSMVLVTEPVLASLANLMDDRTQLADPSLAPEDTSSSSSSYSFSVQEMKMGLQQLGEALLFCHKDACIIHRNVTPMAVFVTPTGVWKLAGFEFATHYEYMPDTLPVFEHAASLSDKCPIVLNPLLDYSAPEHPAESIANPTAKYDFAIDCFSLGCTVYQAFTKAKLLDAGDSMAVYREQVQALPERLATLLQHAAIPAALRADLAELLCIDPARRVSIKALLEGGYFHDVLCKAIRYMDTVHEKDDASKLRFFKALPQILGQMEEKMVRMKALPTLVAEMQHTHLSPAILPNLIRVIKREAAPRTEFYKEAFECIKPVMDAHAPLASILMLVNECELLVDRLPVQVVKDTVVPMLFRSLKQPEQYVDNLKAEPLQHAALDQIPLIAERLDYIQMKQGILPLAQQLALTAPNIAVRVHALACIAKFFHVFDKATVIDSIEPHLRDCVLRDASGPMLMAVLGVQAAVAKSTHCTITAKLILPFLAPLTVNDNLSIDQFDVYMAAVREILGQLERDRRAEILERDAKLPDPSKQTLDADDEWKCFEEEVGHAKHSGVKKGKEEEDKGDKEDKEEASGGGGGDAPPPLPEKPPLPAKPKRFATTDTQAAPAAAAAAASTSSVVADPWAFMEALQPPKGDVAGGASTHNESSKDGEEDPSLADFTAFLATSTAEPVGAVLEAPAAAPAAEAAPAGDDEDINFDDIDWDREISAGREKTQAAASPVLWEASDANASTAPQARGPALSDPFAADVDLLGGYSPNPKQNANGNANGTGNGGGASAPVDPLSLDFLLGNAAAPAPQTQPEAPYEPPAYEPPVLPPPSK